MPEMTATLERGDAPNYYKRFCIFSKKSNIIFVHLLIKTAELQRKIDVKAQKKIIICYGYVYTRQLIFVI